MYFSIKLKRVISLLMAILFTFVLITATKSNYLLASAYEPSVTLNEEDLNDDSNPIIDLDPNDEYTTPGGSNPDDEYDKENAEYPNEDYDNENAYNDEDNENGDD